MISMKRAVWKVMRHAAADDDAGCLRRLVGARNVPAQSQIDALLDEITSSPELLASMDSVGSRAFTPEPADARVRLARQAALGGAGRGRALLLYVTARVLKPRTVVETGCFTGWDSAVLLQALDRNGGDGRLYSIDLPARDGAFSQRGAFASLPEGLRPGFLVPERLRERWTLTEGDVRRELMPLLGRLDGVDFFLHDSDHTYPHMMWEYTALLPHMRDGGIIASDDIAWNTAFWDFAAALGRRPVIHSSNANVGAIAVPERSAA